MLHEDPAKRPHDANALRACLEAARAAAPESTLAAPDEDWRRPGHERARRMALAVVGAAVALPLGLVGAATLRPDVALTTDTAIRAEVWGSTAALACNLGDRVGEIEVALGGQLRFLPGNEQPVAEWSCLVREIDRVDVRWSGLEVRRIPLGGPFSDLRPGAAIAPVGVSGPTATVEIAIATPQPLYLEVGAYAALFDAQGTFVLPGVPHGAIRAASGPTWSRRSWGPVDPHLVVTGGRCFLKWDGRLTGVCL
jgi:hypothetical protein